MKNYKCTKCPGEPCFLTQSDDTVVPEFCPSDDSAHPSASWEYTSQQDNAADTNTGPNCAVCGREYDSEDFIAWTCQSCR